MNSLVLAHPAMIPPAVGFVVGVVAHVCLFKHGEWHVQAPGIALFHCALHLGCPAVAAVCRDASAVGTLADVLVRGSWGYLPGLVGSMVAYRVLLHPLAGFPGPWCARVSKLWHVWAARDSRNHLVLADLHAKYGDFVRTGPAELTVFHPDVFMALDGPRSECVKAEWYDVLHPRIALITARVESAHAGRRREWRRGFAGTALKQHEARILKHVDQLVRCVGADGAAGRASDMGALLVWFGFDAMTDFTFGKSLGMLQSRDWHHIVPKLQSATALLGPLSPAPWLVHLGLGLAPRVGALRAWSEGVAWCSGQMRDRVRRGASSGQPPDLAHYLMEAADGDGGRWLDGDSLLAILAGSEPTAVALMAVFCELARHPRHADAIHRELAGVDVGDVAALARLTHLDGVIKEALRLYPALLTAGNRKTTARGVDVAGTAIPPDTTVVAPRFSIARRDDCFERPLDFVPERWTTRPELVLNRAAYAPFGTGHHSCLGRQLALDTMRHVIARLVNEYRFHAAPGPDSLRVMEDAKDQFTSKPGALHLCFVLRREAP